MRYRSWYGPLATFVVAGTVFAVLIWGFGAWAAETKKKVNEYTRQSYDTTASGAAVAYTVAPGTPWRLLYVGFTASSAVPTANSLFLKCVPAVPTANSLILHSQDMNGLTSYWFAPPSDNYKFAKDDTLAVVMPNTWLATTSVLVGWAPE